MTVHRFGSGQPPSNINVRDLNQIIVLQGPDGKPLWQGMSIITYPMMLYVKQNQTTEQAIAEHMQPNYDFYEKVRIPQYIPKSKTGLGTSALTADGPQKSAT